MSKAFMLLFVILLAFASMMGYLFLSQKIVAGEQQLLDGQRQFAEGQKMLKDGKVKLENGEREMSRVKRVDTFPFVGLAIISLPVSGVTYLEAKKQIVAREKLIRQGQGRVRAGEEQLKMGELQLREGERRLELANKMRLACAFGAIFFVIISIILGFYWRRAKAITK